MYAYLYDGVDGQAGQVEFHTHSRVCPCIVLPYTIHV